MNEILDTVIFRDYTAEDLLIVAAAVAAFLILFIIVKRIFKKNELSEHYQIVACLECGWHGEVSSYAGRCPKCNQPLGDQRAKKR